MSWYQLLDIRKQAEQEFDYFAEYSSHIACPRDGTPLTGPAENTFGGGIELWCPFCFWQYPRDFVRPQRL